MIMNIEQEFQKMISMAYGSQMLTRSQMTELRLSFIGGMLIGYQSTLRAALEGDDDGNLVDKLKHDITRAFNDTNKDR